MQQGMTAPVSLPDSLAQLDELLNQQQHPTINEETLA